MPDLITRKQRLRTLENEIREGIVQGDKHFYNVGTKLKEIRDDHLYEEDDFSTWKEYVDERAGMDVSHANKFILSSSYANAIGTRHSVPPNFTHAAFQQITRVPLQDAARVAKKVEALAEKRGVLPTRAFVREIVDKELDRPPRQPKPEPESKDNGDGNVHRYLDQYTSEIEGMREALEDVPQAGWTLLAKTRPQAIKRLLTACDRLAELLRGVV